MEKKVVVITGCSRGIGFATAELLASEGYIVYACVRSMKNIDQLLTISMNHNNIFIKELDLKKEEEIQRLIKDIESKEGRIDVLINNAGNILFGPVELASLSQMNNQFQINLFGPLRLTQEVIPNMRKRKKGRIIFIGSTSGVKSSGMYGLYSASKFALEAVGHALAVNLSPWNIFVSLIEVSATQTQIAHKSLEIGERVVKNSYGEYTAKSLHFLRSILKQGAQPQQIAQEISRALKDNNPKYRYFATEFAKQEFHRTLTDPYNAGLHDEIKDLEFNKIEAAHLSNLLKEDEFFEHT